MASQILTHHHPAFADEQAHSFEPFDAPNDDNLYTSPPANRETYPRNSGSPTFDDQHAISSAFQRHHRLISAPLDGPLYPQPPPDSLVFHPPVDFSSNPFQSSTSFSSASRGHQHPPNGSLSHQPSLSALYGSDPPFQSAMTSDLFTHPSQQQQQQAQMQQLDHQQALHSSRVPLPAGFAEVTGPSFDPYEFEPTPRGLRHQGSFSGAAPTRGRTMLNGSNALGGGLEGPPSMSQASGAAPLYVSNGASGPSYAATNSGPTLRETLRDAREPRDSSVDGRNGLGRDGTGSGANGAGGGQEEISTIFVVGFPDDMQVSHFFTLTCSHMSKPPSCPLLLETNRRRHLHHSFVSI